MTVLKPERYNDVRALWRDVEAKKTGIDSDDAAVSELGQSRGWVELKKYIDNLKDGLDKRLAEAVLGSLGAEQIKTDALFAVLGKELLNSIVNRVEDVTLAVEEIKSSNDKK